MNEKDKKKLIFASNFNHQLKIHGKTQKDICNLLNVSTSTVSDWSTAKKYPRIDKIQAIADYLDIYKSELTEEYHNQRHNIDAIKIPVLGKVVAGIPIEAIEEILDYEEINLELAKTGDFFALQIKGDSMEPRMQEGDVVIVRKQETVDTGDIAIVLVNGDEATVKKIKILNDGIMLIPFNSKYDPWEYTAEDIEKLPVKIIGKVVELRAKF